MHADQNEGLLYMMMAWNKTKMVVILKAAEAADSHVYHWNALVV